jgi:hypothetical protein
MGRITGDTTSAIKMFPWKPSEVFLDPENGSKTNKQM